MSRTDTERFVADVKGSPELRKALDGKVGIPAMVEVATAHGYEITEADAREYLAANTNVELSDEQLEDAAGGNPNTVIAGSWYVLTKAY